MLSTQCRLTVTVVFLVGTAPAPAIAQVAAQAPAVSFDWPRAKYEVRVEENVMIPMRDGVRLATDLYFPIGATGRLPVVLVRTAYDKIRQRQNRSVTPFAEQGYVMAVQDKRGKFASEGEYAIFGSDRTDGYDTIDWLARQPWSTGRVGTFGCSYNGGNQYVTAASRHPSHAAAVPMAGAGAIGKAGNSYRFFGVYEGGAFSLRSEATWFPRNGLKDRSPPRPIADLEAALRTLPVVDLLDRHGIGPTEWKDYVTRPLADPWWDARGYIRDDDRFDVPALHINSWYDSRPAEQLYLAELMRRNAVSARGRDNQYVVISATSVHCGFDEATENTRSGDLDVGDARFPFRELYLRWFDHWLKNEPNGVTQMPKIQYYVTGRNEWRGSDVWPPAGTAMVPWYLRSGGRANTRDGDGQLSPQPPVQEPPDRFRYDPGDPVPSPTGPGPVDHSATERRPDVLVYTSAPIADGFEVAGSLKAVLYVSSSARDTDLVVRLLDVHPNGRSYMIQEAIKRVRYRDGYDRPVLMRPGEVYRVDVDLHATAHWFRPGHRLRLQVTGSNFPAYDRNLNTGGNNYDETTWVVAENRIHHADTHASHVLLPVRR